MRLSRIVANQGQFRVREGREAERGAHTSETNQGMSFGWITI